MTMTKVIEGTHAVSYAVTLSRVRVVAAYPITPSSGVVELLSEMCGDGRFDARFVAVESEHSALATCAGVSQTGLRAFTATSSHGLAYAHEMLHWCAGARLPIVLANVNRAIGSPWNILVDQSDSLAQRDTGWMQYYCEDNQEVLDTIIQAYRVAEQVRMPAMVCLDAFFLSHTSEPVAIPDQALVDRFLPPFASPYAISTDDPRAVGGMPVSDSYMEHRARMERSMLDAVDVAEAAAREYADLFGRYHPILETYRAEGADLLLVTSGTIAGTARAVIDARRETGERIGLARIRLFRPFPFATVRQTFAGTRKLAVIDRNLSFGHGGIMASEIRSALCNQPEAPVVLSYIAGLGGRDVTPEVIDDVIEHARTSDSSKGDTLWVGLKE